ncbi:hypothetical protein SAMN04244572_04389 [Azotobacter beijerinckii]|uniref:Uncharacterized protein n=1 Tax=Azotobacter beijerinckii TaxID=170623 RepID=A0A1H6ZK47_9GAMM|nr:hypothetical protein [Azotobacter beijerinckii]SEJ53799.1 hypothetical protein SAMN04244572_04389 [Azotobacter beijerinckii]
MTEKKDSPSEQFALELPQAEDERAGDNLLASHFRLKAPCIECPLLKTRQNIISPKELEKMIADLLAHDFSTRQCQRVRHFREYALLNKKGNFSSDAEAMCAGAAALLLKRNSPTLGMRVAISTEAIQPDHWDEAKPLVID